MNARRPTFKVAIALCVLAGVLLLVTAPALAAAPEAPEVTVGSPVRATEATLYGILDPGLVGEPGTYETGTYEFLYKQGGASCEGENTAPASPGLSLGAGHEELPAEALTGLAANTEYTVCLRIETAGGTTVGPAVHFTTALPPETPETKPANPITATTATLKGVLNPTKLGNTGSYQFFYRQSATECRGENEVATPAVPAFGTVGEAVEAPVSELLPDRQYTFCLLARNEAGEEALGAPETFSTPPLPPAIEGESATEVQSTEAILSAQINPEGQVSTYHVEYGTSESYGQSTRETGVGAAGFTAVSEQVRLRGLQPGRTYHYRFVATNASHETTRDEEGQTFTTPPLPLPPGSEHCPNEASRQGPSLVLPQCRAYEQVTPVDKGATSDIFDSKGFFPQDEEEAYVAEDGDALLLHTRASLAPEAPVLKTAYVFTRGIGGWSMDSVARSVDQPQYVEAEVFDPTDLSEVGFFSLSGTYDELEFGDESAFQYKNLVGPTGGPYAPVRSLNGLAAYETKEQVRMVGGSEDLSRVILESGDHALAPGAEGQDQGTDALYEWSGRGECASGSSSCKLVDVDPEGSAFQCGATIGHGQVGEGGGDPTAVSRDGSKVFFTAPDPGVSGLGCWNPGATPQENPPELYMREGGTRTVEISKPEEGVQITAENPQRLAVFVGASSDGSKVFFMTTTELTKGATGHAPELYEYETESGRLTLISGGEAGTLEGDVDSVTAVSSDGSTVYFSAYGKLADGASQYPPGKESFSPVNLYRYDTLTGATTFITTLNKFDYPGGFGQHIIDNWYEEELGGTGTEREGMERTKEWYTTTDGQFLVFGTILPLTGFDNTEAPGAECPNNYAGGPGAQTCYELYRYDAATNSIVCVSCFGGPPVDGAYFARTEYNSPDIGPPRPISENGEDVFFESANALVPQVTPGKVHVYEWHDGVISLISSPNDPGNAFFLGSSAEGANVLFSTHAQLVPQDTDEAADIYDARVDGGFAGVTPPQCTGSGCQGVPAAPPIFATPASVTFEGVGNFPASEPSAKPASKPRSKPKKCKARFVKQHGRCVKVKKKAKRSAKGRK